MPTLSSRPTTVWQRLALALTLSLTCALAHADPVTFTGSVADCSNPALVGSGPNAPAPSCDSAQDTANNVALYTFSVPFGGFTDFNFGGFSDIDFAPFFLNAPPAGALQPYLSVFLGTGNSASFFTSSRMNQSSGPDLRVFLNAGVYTLAISNRTNLSFAELTGGTLGQGFTGRGDPASVGNGRYQLTASVPEPDSAWLAAIGVAALVLRRRRRRAADVATDVGVSEP